MSASAHFPRAFKTVTISFDIACFLALALKARCVRIVVTIIALEEVLFYQQKGLNVNSKLSSEGAY